MIINPSDEKFLLGQFQEITDFFIIPFETNQIRMVLQVDLGQHLDSNDLPDESKDNVLSLINNTVIVDIHADASNCFS